MEWSAENAVLELWRRLDFNQKPEETVICLKLHLRDAYGAGFKAAAEISDRVTREASPTTARDVLRVWIDELESAGEAADREERTKLEKQE